MKKTVEQIPRVLLLFMVFVATGLYGWAQNAVSGTVIDSRTGAPVPNVTVSIKGTTISTQTGPDGNYRLSAPDANPTLVFTSVGYASTESLASSSASVSLVQTNQQLTEVVVVGYGTARKKDLTGAVSTVTAKDFQKGVIATPEQMIAGKVSGVSIISNGGRPGGGSTIRIRGGSSLAASNDPLIVLDGVPLDRDGIAGAQNALSFINSDDVESFTVLKDASAAAIYGTRAANGVIIITTKKGRGGALKINFNTNLAISKITETVDVLNGDQVRQIVKATGTPAQVAQLGTANTNWQDAIYQTALSTNNNLSFTGGIKGLPFRVSIGYQYLNGILKTDHLQKWSAALALNPTFFNKHLKVDINLKASAEDARIANTDAIGNAVSFDPTQNIYSPNQTYGGYFQWLEADGKLKLNRQNNPYATLNQTWETQKPKRSIGNVQLDYSFHFLPELHANLNLAYDVSKSRGRYYVPANAAVFYTSAGQNNPTRQTKRNSVVDFYLNYIKDIKSINSRVDITAGYSYNNYLTTNYNFRAFNAKGDTIPGTKDVVFPFDKPEHSLIGYFGRLNYTLNDKWLLTATVRRDGSSRFGPGNKWGTFPSVALGWKLKEESFLRNSKTVSDLKLRLGYGVTGQQDGIGNYDYLSTYALSTQNGTYPFGDIYNQMYAPSGFYKNLKWEETTTYNAAIDYGFLNNRIYGSVDFYYKKTTDLLNSTAQPAGTNFSAYVLANVGDMENKGVEVNLNVQPIRKANVTLDINVNGTYNKNTITNLTVVENDPKYIGLLSGGAAGVNGFIFNNAVGGPKNTFYLYHQVYDKNGKPIEGLFEDINRDGIINEQDKYKGKMGDPNLFFGFSSNLNVKNWNVGFVLRSSFNNYVYNNVYSNLGKLNQVNGVYVLGNASVNYLDTKFTGSSSDFQPLSDYYIENASFLRMDNASVGYNVGKLAKSKVAMRLSATVQNVFVVTKYKGLDPEVGGGIDNNLYPRPRVYTFGINLDF